MHMGTKRYYSLNKTGAFIWRALEDGVSRADIVARLIDAYDVGAAEADMAVTRLMGELVEEGLIVAASA
ncbi:MAG: PqqD family protein [Gemmatimonadaceae bacterium]